MVVRYALLVGGTVIGVLSVPLALGLVPPNPTYGFRTAATMANPRLWHEVNVFCGWALLLAAITSAVLLFRLPPSSTHYLPAAFTCFVAPLLCALAASFAYLAHLT